MGERDSDLQEEVGDIVGSILEDISEEEELPEIEEVDKEGWFKKHYTYTQQIDADGRTRARDAEFDKLAGGLDIDEQTIEMARSIFEQYADFSDTDFIVELYAAASVYCACKLNKVPLDPTEFVEAGEDLLTRKILLRRSKRIASTLGLDAEAFLDSGRYIDRYCDELDLSTTVRERAKYILDICESHGLASGKSPSGLAAAAIYNATREAGLRVTQTDLSEIAHVTEVTIRHRYQEQRDLLNELESAPDSVEESVTWAANRMNAESEVVERSKRLVRLAEDTDLDLQDRPSIWALAALQVSSEALDDPIGIRTLKSLVNEESSMIHHRVKELKSELRSINVDPFAPDMS